MKAIATTCILIFMLVSFAFCQKKVVSSQIDFFNGTLKHVMFYGPPGFGENPKHDAKEWCYILYLDNSILFKDTTETGDNQFKEIKNIQVVSNKCKKFVNQKVRITCMLETSVTGHHHGAAMAFQVFRIELNK